MTDTSILLTFTAAGAVLGLGIGCLIGWFAAARLVTDVRNTKPGADYDTSGWLASTAEHAVVARRAARRPLTLSDVPPPAARRRHALDRKAAAR